MKYINLLYDDNFKKELASKISESGKKDNLYRILFDFNDDSSNHERSKLERCCKTLFEFTNEQKDNYISKLTKIDLKNPSYEMLKETLNELKVAYVLNDLGFALNFDIKINDNKKEKKPEFIAENIQKNML